jgi:conjugal transfer pilus assembly protein TraW
MARAGEHFNPIQMINMPMAMIIFNPSDPRQAEYAKQQQRELIGKMRVQLIASQFDSNMTWQKYGQMMQSFGARIFKLNRELVDKFEIRHVPTVITTENGLFRYHVLGESDLPEGKTAVVITSTE